MPPPPKPTPPRGYPTAPACFRRHDLASLEQQYQFYERAYAAHGTSRLGSGTRAIIQYLTAALHWEWNRQADGVQATLL